MTKRKLLLVAMALCMVAILVVGGTLAYFTDTDQNTNTFTIGHVDITLDEAPVTKNDDDQWVADDTAKRVQENTYEKVYPGAVLPKDPTVHINEGSQDAYVRVKVTIKPGFTMLPYYVEDKTLDDTLYTEAFMAFINNKLGENWVITEHTDPFNVDNWFALNPDTSFTFVINYTERLAAGDSTSAVFEEVVIFSGWDHKDLQMLGLLDGEFTIDVFAEAIQAEGFTDTDGDGFIYDEAFAAFDAQVAVTQ